MAREEFVDRSECSLVETKPNVQGGAPVLRGTRMPADAIVQNFDYGVDAAEIAELFERPEDVVRCIVTYAQGHRIVSLKR